MRTSGQFAGDLQPPARPGPSKVRLASRFKWIGSARPCMIRRKDAPRDKELARHARSGVVYDRPTIPWLAGIELDGVVRGG
jgi:hypothetical protein